MKDFVVGNRFGADAPVCLRADRFLLSSTELTFYDQEGHVIAIFNFAHGDYVREVESGVKEAPKEKKLAAGT